MVRPKVLAFDVNETLLDLRALDAPFERVFGDPGLRPVWFQTMLQLSFVGGLTRAYVDFTSAQYAALQMIAERIGSSLSTEDADSIVMTMLRLPAHPDALPALTRLRQAGFRQVTLTNSPLEVVQAQMDSSGLKGLFDDLLSADEVKRLKPAAAPYRLVADRHGVLIEDVCLVAAHAWDISGALSAGAQAAFVARPGVVLSPLGPRPNFVGADLAEIADALLAEPTTA
jgi:2-haloacid dehalogenase